MIQERRSLAWAVAVAAVAVVLVVVGDATSLCLHCTDASGQNLAENMSKLFLFVQKYLCGQYLVLIINIVSSEHGAWLMRICEILFNG